VHRAIQKRKNSLR